MSDVLSQSEIDELFYALKTGDLDFEDMVPEDDSKNIKEYNFKRPSKFSKEQLRTLENIFENYGRLISNFLSGIMGNAVSIESIAAEAITYSEFSNSLSSPVLLSVVGFDSTINPYDSNDGSTENALEGLIIVDFSTALCFVLLDRLLGGVGAPMQKMREFTDIELTILQKIMKQLVKLLKNSFENVVDITPSLQKIETNSQVVQIIAPSETVALITIKIQMGDVEGRMNICLPYLVLEPIMDKLNTKFWFSHSQQESDISNRYIKKTLDNTNVSVKAILGKTTISFAELLSLRIGDCVKLDNSINSDLKVFIGNELKYTAKAGISNNKKAIKIKSVIKGEDE